MWLLLPFSVAASFAASAPPSLAGTPVPVGSWVRITHWDCSVRSPDSFVSVPLEDPAVCPALRTEGRMIAGDHEHFNLRRRSQEYVVSLASERIIRLEVRKARSLAKGAAKGLKTGALVGLAVAFLGCVDEDGCGESSTEVMGWAGTVIGASAATGATIGLVFGGRQWESIPLGRRSYGSDLSAPARRAGGGLGLALRLSF